MTGIEAAHEQLAEDARFDVGPVQLHHAGQNLDRLTIDRQGRRVVIEQAAVEVPDVLDAKIAAGRHRRKELAQLRRKPIGLHAPLLDQLREDVVVQQIDIFGEQAEQATNEEVRDGLWRSIRQRRA